VKGRGTERKLGVREVFEVLYSPAEAFKKIIEKPEFKGVLLILVLVMVSMTFAQSVIASKFFPQIEAPDNDKWTESVALWTSNGVISNDTDRIIGNNSIKSLVSNGTSIWMKITDIGTFDCSGDKGYTELFFWIKWVHENGTFPSNATLRLFSGSESSYFELVLTNLISNSSDEWSNATVNNETLKIGPGQGWESVNSPDWKSVTGLEFRLEWPDSANLTMKIDDLHFRRYVSLLETGAFSGSIISILIYAIMDFSMNWILWAGVLLLTVKAFREKGGPWMTFFIIIGHVFSVTVIYWLASAVLVSTLPPLNLPLTSQKETIPVDGLIQERWQPNWAYQLSFLYFPLLREIWTAVLCAVAIRFLCGITWQRAASIAVIAFLFRFVLRLFLGF